MAYRAGRARSTVFRGGNDKVEGGDGNDTINTNGGNDKVEGGLGDDTIDSGAGNDKIEDKAGTNTARGGAGSDVFEVNATTALPDFDATADRKETEDDEDDDDEADGSVRLRNGQLKIEGTALRRLP